MHFRLLILAALANCLPCPFLAAEEKPNVLFIVVDDLNDWIGCLDGHPQAKTPHIDRLSERGMLFTNAHCTSPLCNPSRASVLTGLLPSTNGVHGNQQDWRQSPYLQGKATIPQYFQQHGYWTGGCGKIFHANHGGECGALNGGHGGLRGFNQPEAWSERHPSKDRQLATPAVMPGQNRNGLDIWHWDWGPIDVPDSATTDGQATDWAVRQLQKKHDQPFFLAVGIYRPHGPWYVPEEYFRQHPLSQVVLPQLKPDDMDDVPAIAKRYLRNPHHLHKLILDNHLYESAVQAYLANVTFADAMVGKVLGALADSPYADNTVICLWSDHGWHLGEKQRWHKSTNWEEATRVPLIISAPDAANPGARCSRAVSLVDIFPTLTDLCGLPMRSDLDGLSLTPLLQDPQAARDRPAITTNAGVHHSARSDDWRYIRYADGSEELYHHANDPNEYDNLAGNPQFQSIKLELAASIPNKVNRVEPTDEERDDGGFRPLFNGYDLTGWDGDRKLWQVKDEAIVGKTTPDNPLPHNKFLIWRGGQVKNFELRLECRLLGDNNSGIQYRSRLRNDLGEWAVGGYQADIHPTPDNNGMLYEEKGRGILAQRNQKVVIAADGTRVVDDNVGNRQPIDVSTWNTYTIIARGDRLIHKVNGEVTVDVIDHQQDARAQSGVLALQLHRGAVMEVQFRNVRLKSSQ